jgi:hypothetical protein
MAQERTVWIMNKQRVRLLASALAVITCLSIVFLGGRIALAQSSGTVTQLSAAYNSSAGKVQVSGSAVDLAKGIVVVEIHTPSGTLLYFGTTSADENGNFAVSVTVGTLKAGTYTVRSADYTGGAYKVATFTVTQSGSSSPPSTEPSGPPPAQTPVTEVAASTDVITSITTVSGTVDRSGDATISVAPAQINSALNAALETAAKEGTNAIALTIAAEVSMDIKSSATIIPKESMNLIAASPVKTLTVSTPVASISFDEKTLDGISSSAGQNVSVLAALVDNEAVSSEVRQVAGDRPVFSFSVTSGATTISEFDGTVTVSVPYTLRQGEDPDAVIIYFINSEGKPEPVTNCVYDPVTKTATFKTTHFSIFTVGYNKVIFADVSDTAWYSRAVGFIAARGITTGIGNMNYGPLGQVTRGQFLVMTMRAYGIVPDENVKDNFTDAGNTYYTPYLAAAKRLGISDGVGNNLFAPDKKITRQEMFVLLYRTLGIIGGLPSGDSGRKLSSFDDAALFEPWAQTAAEAMVKGGIIRGDGNKLNPAQTATRAEMAQMFFALLSKQ